MSEPNESEGPDRCRGDIRCQDFHDTFGRRLYDSGSGTGTGTGSGDSPAAIGGSYNCCCCDPCRFVTPEPLTQEEDEQLYCCKCFPRGLYLRFVPDDPTAECCRTIGIALFHNRGPAESYYFYYTATLFGLTIEIRVGRVVPVGTGTGTGTGTLLGCGWRIIATGGTGTGTFADVDEVIEIDHDDTQCLYVPEGIPLFSAEGPDGCLGAFYLEDLFKARLPFIERTEATLYADSKFQNVSCGGGSTGTGTGTGTGENSECTQVCTKICVTGERHAPGARERVEFTWYDYSSETGTGTLGVVLAGTKGWYYQPPGSDFIERIILETVSGGCRLRPEFEAGAEDYQPQFVDATTKCSCKMNETFVGPTIGDYTYSFTVRCGFCSCWDFVCADCRCVPRSLCVVLYDGSSIQTFQSHWNPFDRCWEDADDVLRLCLRADANDNCIIVPVLYGVELDLDSPPTYDCGSETVTGQFDGSHDFLTISVDDEITVATGTGTGTALQPIFISATALQPNCDTGYCDEATPCLTSCGSHPSIVLLTLTQWTQCGDTSGCVDGIDCTGDETCNSCAIEVFLYYFQTANSVAGGETQYSCGYVGFFLYPYRESPASPKCTLCAVKVILRDGEVTFQTFPRPLTDCVFDYAQIALVESCNPYSGDSGAQMGSPIDGICLGCGPDGSTRYQIIVTEIS